MLSVVFDLESHSIRHCTIAEWDAPSDVASTGRARHEGSGVLEPQTTDPDSESCRVTIS